MLTYKSNVPDWIRTWAGALVDLLGLGFLDIEVAIVTFADADLTGRTSLNYRYYRARVELVDTLTDTRDGQVTICHEFIHCLTIRHEQAIARVIDLVDEPRRDVARDLWNDADEPTTETFARSLQAYLSRVLTPGAE